MDIISKYFPDLSPRQIEQFKMLGPLYAEWNQKNQCRFKKGH